MATKTAIKWTDHTFNIVWGCTKVSPGCKNCYADTLATRYGYDVWGQGKPRRMFGDKHWHEPVKWNRLAEREGVRRKVFCSSMCDLFEDHPTTEEELQHLWPLIRATPWLDWQLLTKRAERIASSLPSDWGGGYANAWLGVSIENNDYVERADHLRTIPATVRFVSYEPALGPLDVLDLTGIDWVIYGGESGHYFRRHEESWACDIYRRCQASGVAFFFKQSSGLYPGRGVELDGRVIQEFPQARPPLPAHSTTSYRTFGIYCDITVDPPAETRSAFCSAPYATRSNHSRERRSLIRQMLSTATKTVCQSLLIKTLLPGSQGPDA